MRLFRLVSFLLSARIPAFSRRGHVLPALVAAEEECLAGDALQGGTSGSSYRCAEGFKGLEIWPLLHRAQFKVTGGCRLADGVPSRMET